MSTWHSITKIGLKEEWWELFAIMLKQIINTFMVVVKTKEITYIQFLDFNN